MFHVFTAREVLTRMRKGKFDTVAPSLVKSYAVCQAITDGLLCSVYSYIFLVSSLQSHFVLRNKDRAQGKPTKKNKCAKGHSGSSGSAFMLSSVMFLHSVRVQMLNFKPSTCVAMKRLLRELNLKKSYVWSDFHSLSQQMPRRTSDEV